MVKPRLRKVAGRWLCYGDLFSAVALQPQNAYWLWRLEYDRVYAFKPVDLGAPA